MARVGVPLVEVLRLPGFGFEDLPPEPAEHEVAEGHQRRLGKDLATIMPGADARGAARRRGGGVASVIPIGPPPEQVEADEAPAPSTHPSMAAAPAPASAPAPTTTPDAAPTPAATALLDRLHGDLVAALLDGLGAATGAELVAYVHHPDRGEPRLHLRRPALGELDPARCYALFRTFESLARSRPGVAAPFAAGGFEGVGVVVAGVEARGLWIAARSAGPMAGADVEAAVDYARSTGAGATLLDLRTAAVPDTTPNVVVHVEEGQVQAVVELASGAASAGAPTSVEAAARATIAAVRSRAEFLYAAAARDEHTAASIVLVREGDRVGVGCAGGPGEAPTVTSVAALRAARRDVS